MKVSCKPTTLPVFSLQHPAYDYTASAYNAFLRLDGEQTPEAKSTGQRQKFMQAVFTYCWGYCYLQ
jgi:hypothetical protein